jgi:hypothetical protein
MIDKTMIDPKRLLDLILDDAAGNINPWWSMVEFVKDYMPPYPRPDTRPTRWSVKCGESYLRDLGRGYFCWDIHYGEDSEMNSPEGCVRALMQAPVPPHLLKAEVWEARKKGI